MDPSENCWVKCSLCFCNLLQYVLIFHICGMRAFWMVFVAMHIVWPFIQFICSIFPLLETFPQDNLQSKLVWKNYPLHLLLSDYCWIFQWTDSCCRSWTMFSCCLLCFCFCWSSEALFVGQNGLQLCPWDEKPLPLLLMWGLYLKFPPPFVPRTTAHWVFLCVLHLDEDGLWVKRAVLVQIYHGTKWVVHGSWSHFSLRHCSWAVLFQVQVDLW